VVEIHPNNSLIIKFFDENAGEVNSNDPNNKLGAELFELIGSGAFSKIGAQFTKLVSASSKNKS
jgi:hypothetical protein